MQELFKRNRRGLFIGGAICAGALILALPGLPWLKQEITESAQVVFFNDGSCVVETTSRSVIHIDNCAGKSPGDEVTVKYRATTKVGDLIGE